MPLRDDLLEPIEGENPSGPDLRYDKVFEQIKEARIEEDDSMPTGDWGRAPKKADRVLVIKQAGEMLAKRTKDLLLAGWYLESLVRKEGFGQLVPGLDFLWKLQDIFWDTVHPERDEDGNADLRIGAIELTATLLTASLKGVPLTRSGFDWVQYQDARAIGFEADATSSDKSAARAEAIEAGRPTGEDLQKSVDGTPKAFYVETEASLTKSLELLDELDRFHEEKYGEDYPSLGRFKTMLGDLVHIVGGILREKRKSDPDPVAPGEESEEPVEEGIDPFAQYDVEEAQGSVQEVVPARAAAKRKTVFAGAPTDAESAYAQVQACAEFLRTESGSSPVPYLLCSALRMGETRNADIGDYSFAVAPSTETRQALRRLANESNWDELMQLCLRTLAEPCGRVWLDLHRYAWRAASENGNSAIANSVISNVRGLLVDMPSLVQLTLDDDTPAANAETQQWLGAEVLQPPPAAEVEETSSQPSYEPPAYTHSAAQAESVVPDIYQTAQQVLKQGKVAEAISLLVRDSESQPSGRMRFLRRVQMAQLCLAADQGTVAYPVLLDLSNEMERRALESWEAAEMLAQPLSLLLRCLDNRKGNEEAREAVFSRLCRLDPQAALSVRR